MNRPSLRDARWSSPLRRPSRFEFAPTSFQHGAGLSYRYDERNQYYAYVTLGDKGVELNLLSVIAGKTELWLPSR